MRSYWGTELSGDPELVESGVEVESGVGVESGVEVESAVRRCGVTVYGVGFRTWLKLS